jgi:LPXTG-site transpeptidase (sortase) family protein
MKKGELGVPSDIHKVGWWRDGAAPGDKTGSILLAGHVDSAKDGAGAFYGLKAAHTGDIVSLTSSDGKTRKYRVASVKLVLKAALPTSIFSRTGSPRLVLVTCSGPFDTKTGHYRDNLVVTATPV